MAQGRMPWLLAVLAVVLVFAVEQWVEHFQVSELKQHHRAHVANQLSTLRAKLESVVTGNLLAIRGLTAVIAAEPDIDQQRFASIARGLVGENTGLKVIAGAPDLVIRLLYPMRGNEAALGLNYRTHPTQSQAAMRAVETGKVVVAGPLPLVQGGEALIARAPVYLSDPTGSDTRVLWGLVSAVMETGEILRFAGLPPDHKLDGLTLAIRGRDGLGDKGGVFYGEPSVFAGDALILNVNLPDGLWQIGGLPVGGWHKVSEPNAVNRIRITGLLLAALLAILVFQLARSHQTLRQKSAALAESQSLFAGFMQNLPAGAYVRDLDTHRPLFENQWLRNNLPGHGVDCDTDSPVDPDALAQGAQMLHQRFEHPDGRVIYCDTLRFILSVPEHPSMIGGVVMDVTERVMAANALSENRARLRALLDTLPDLAWLKDPDGVYLACNRRFEALFGAPEQGIVGKRDTDFVDEDLATLFRENDRAAMTAGRPVMNEEAVTFASDGHRELLETIKAPVFGEDGKLMGVLGVARDITERKRMDRDLRARLDELTRWQNVVLGREDRIMELKREVNTMLKARGEPLRYAAKDDAG